MDFALARVESDTCPRAAAEALTGVSFLMDLWDLQIPDFKERFFVLIFPRTNYSLHLRSEAEPLGAVKGAFSFSTRTEG